MKGEDQDNTNKHQGPDFNQVERESFIKDKISYLFGITMITL
jgi:hypothetical protein